MKGGLSKSPLIVLVGETASGKTNLAIKLAKRFGGEIIAADSRTFYRGMNIGTAKPTKTERGEVHHHLIDIADPDEPITVADFKQLATGAIENIAGRGKLPILVGGSGLYIDALIFDFALSGRADQQLRVRLQGLAVDELQGELRSRGIPLPANPRNPRHLIRCLETGGQTAKQGGLRERCLVLGKRVEREELRARVVARTDKMFDDGLPDEVECLIRQYSSECPALRTIGYQEFFRYFAGQATLGETKADIIRATLQYAKRQRTWFRRNKSIHYICSEEEAVDLITTFLNNLRTV